jgi:hypothetical protein
MRRAGSVSAALSIPICSAVACRMTTAVSGRARVVMADPKPEMDCPIHNLRNSAWDQRVLEACESAISHPFLGRELRAFSKWLSFL